MKNSRLRADATPEERLALNRLAREQCKRKLLADIRLDIEVCRIEGWDCKEYLNELKEIVDGFLR